MFLRASQSDYVPTVNQINICAAQKNKCTGLVQAHVAHPLLISLYEISMNLNITHTNTHTFYIHTLGCSVDVLEPERLVSIQLIDKSLKPKGL